MAYLPLIDASIYHPQALLNQWPLALSISKEEDRIHAQLKDLITTICQ